MMLFFYGHASRTRDPTYHRAYVYIKVQRHGYDSEYD